jgi:hypothetical protein
MCGVKQILIVARPDKTNPGVGVVSVKQRLRRGSALDSDNVRLPPLTALHVNAAATYFNPSTNEGPYNGRPLSLFLLWTRLIRKHYLLSAQSGVPCCPLLIDFFLDLFHAFEMPFTTSAERSGSSYYNSHFNYHHFHEPTCPSPRRRRQGLCPSTG